MISKLPLGSSRFPLLEYDEKDNRETLYKLSMSCLAAFSLHTAGKAKLIEYFLMIIP